MKQYTFLIGWIAHSESADGIDTRINSSEDLVDGFISGNDHVKSFDVEAETEEQALQKGYAWAFHQNFTAYDTVTEILEM